MLLKQLGETMLRSTRVPVIAMPRRDMAKDDQRCLAAGIEGYLTEWLEPDQLLGRIEMNMAPRNSVATIPTTSPDFMTEDPAIFNPAVALERCVENRLLLAQVIQYFFSEAATLLPQMDEAIKTQDWSRLARTAHHLKGTLLYLGVDRAEAAIRTVEQLVLPQLEPELEAGDTFDPLRVAEAFQRLEQACDELKRVLAEHPLSCPPPAA